jgi:hypothetical protein
MPAFGSMLPWDGGDRRFSVYPPSYNTSNVSVGSGGIERVRRVQLSTSMPAFGSMLSWDGGDRRFSVYPPSYNTSNVSVGSGGIERV